MPWPCIFFINDYFSRSLFTGSQELLDMCGNDYDFEEDSVFTDDGGAAATGNGDVMNSTLTSGRSSNSHKSAASAARRRLNYNTLQVG